MKDHQNYSRLCTANLTFSHALYVLLHRTVGLFTNVTQLSQDVIGNPIKIYHLSLVVFDVQPNRLYCFVFTEGRVTGCR